MMCLYMSATKRSYCTPCSLTQAALQAAQDEAAAATADAAEARAQAEAFGSAMQVRRVNDCLRP